MHLLSRLYLEAHSKLLAIGHEPVDLLFRQRERIAHLHTGTGIILKVLYLVAFGLQFFRSVKGYVGFSTIKQLPDILLIDFPALALAVRPVVASEGNTFVERYAEPAKRLNDIFFSAGHKAVGVGVFYSEYKFAAVLTGEKIIVKGGTHAADMQCAGGAGRKTHSYFSFCHAQDNIAMKTFLCKFTYFFCRLGYFFRKFAE